MARAVRRPAVDGASPTRGEELSIFLLLAVVLAPVLAVMVVGGYGFTIWMYQLLAGPPGPPPL